MVATDGHRLSYARRKASLKLTEPQRVLIPRKAIYELKRLLEEGGRPRSSSRWRTTSCSPWAAACSRPR